MLMGLGCGFQIDEGKFLCGTGMESGIGRHEAYPAEIDRCSEVEAILDSMSDLESDGPGRSDQRFVGD